MFWLQSEGKLEVFIKSNRYLIPIDDFKKFLEKETAKCLVDEEFYTTLLDCRQRTGKVFRVEDYEDDHYTRSSSMVCQTQKAMYYNVLHFILCNMKHTVKVWVYDDGTVRLYQEDEWCSIWWDTPSCYTHPLNLWLLDKLVEFVKQYK